MNPDEGHIGKETPKGTAKEEGSPIKPKQRKHPKVTPEPESSSNKAKPQPQPDRDESRDNNQYNVPPITTPSDTDTKMAIKPF